jgi:hypothetical protein
MIHAVFCANTVEKDTAVALYKGRGLEVTWFGPDAAIQPEKFSGQAIVACNDCAVGPDAYVVVAYPPGKGPFPG